MIVKSLATFFNVILVYLYFNEKTSLRASLCCLVIIVGFLTGINTENQLSNVKKKSHFIIIFIKIFLFIDGIFDIGIIYGVLSSLFSALFGVYIKKTIQLFNKNLWKLNFYTNLFASISLIPLIFLMKENENIMSFPNLFSIKFWFFMFLSGFLC